MDLIKIIPFSDKEHTERCAKASGWKDTADMMGDVSNPDIAEKAYLPSTAEDCTTPDEDVITDAKPGTVVFEGNVNVFYFHSARGGPPCIALDNIEAYKVKGHEGLWAKEEDVIEM